MRESDTAMLARMQQTFIDYDNAALSMAKKPTSMYKHLHEKLPFNWYLKKLLFNVRYDSCFTFLFER